MDKELNVFLVDIMLKLVMLMVLKLFYVIMVLRVIY